MKAKKILGLTAVTVAAGMMLAACGGSSSSSDSSGSAASGPIKIGMFATTSAGSPSAFVNTWSVDGVQAAAKAINAAGGINGRQLEVTVCDNAGDPNRDATCARDAVNDEWVAVVGGFDPYAPAQTLPVLESAGIPYVGYLAGTPIEYQSSVSFPVEIGTVGGYVGTFKMMVDDGCKSPVFIATTDSGSEETIAQAEAAFAAPGVTGKVVPFQSGTTDVTPIIASALADNPDCVFFGGAGPDAAKIYTQIRNTGSGANVALYSSPGIMQPQVVSALGAIAEGIRGASSAPLASNPDPSMKQFMTDLTAFNPEGVPNEFSINGYAAVQLFKEVASKIDGDITAESLLNQLNQTTDVKVMAFPALDFTKTRDSELYPRMFNTSVWYSQIKDGQWTGVDAQQSATDVSTVVP